MTSESSFINPFTKKSETKAERIARYEDDVREYTKKAMMARRGFKAKLTKMANIKRRQVEELKAME